MPSRRAFVGLGAAGLAGAFAFWQFGCNPKFDLLGMGIDVSRAAIGVARTHSGRKLTRVFYLSPELETVGSVDIHRPDMGNNNADTCCVGGQVYTFNDASKTYPFEGNRVFCLDVTTQTLTTWKVDSPWCLAVSDTYVYALQNYAPVSVASIDTTNGETLSVELPNLSQAADMPGSIQCYEGSVWAANAGSLIPQLVVHQLSEDLSLVASTTIGLPSDADDAITSLSINNICGHDGYLYLAVGAANDSRGMGVPLGCVCRFDTRSGEYEWIKLAEGYVQTLRFVDDRIVVLHSDRFDGVPRVCIYDNTSLLVRSDVLSDRPLQMVVVDGVVYLTSQDEVCALSLDTLEELKRIKLDVDGEGGVNSELFAMP